MTWEQLKAYVNKYYQNYNVRLVVGDDHIGLGDILLTNLGEVILLNDQPYPYKTSKRIRKKISFEQMKLIIDGIFGDKKGEVQDGN